MDIESLRRWVRRELPPDERREVGRWMLRSTDPDLPGILQGLVREHEDELADAAVALRKPSWAVVLELWRTLQQTGQTIVEALRPPDLAGGAVLAPSAQGAALSFRRDSGEVVVDLVLQDRARVALFGTTDQPEEFLLMSPTVLEPGPHVDVTRWTPEDADGRVTLWLVMAEPQDPELRFDRLAEVVALHRAGTVEILAGRWLEADD